MSIRQGCQVEVLDGPFAGCFGEVKRIWLDEHHRAQIIAQIWHGEGGRFMHWIFNPESLKSRRVRGLDREFMRLAAIDQHFEEKEAA